jgi:hypothetical protein
MLSDNAVLELHGRETDLAFPIFVLPKILGVFETKHSLGIYLSRKLKR